MHISEICQSWGLGTRLVSAPRFELLGMSSPDELEAGLGGEGSSGGVLPRKIAEDGRRRELKAGLLVMEQY